MRRTRINELFGIEHPVIQGGMIWTSGWKLAVAVAKAGGLGLIGAGSMTPELLDEHLIEARREAPDAPWGVNLPIFYDHAEAMIQVILSHGVRVVFTSGGSPKKYTGRLKEAGCTVVHVSASPTLAKKCEDAGVDAVVVEGFEAGGHNGREELTTMTLVPQAVDRCSIPVIAAGGIYDGRTMAAALALGAEGVQVGSRFAATVEASCHPSFKRAIVEAGDNSTMLILRKLIPVRVIMNQWAVETRQAETDGASQQELLEKLGSKRSRLGMFEGDLEMGELEIGQVSGAITDLLPAGEVLARMVTECDAALERLAALRLTPIS
jgi:enoyl-[acyl-carrier protein] reductase II